jgi:mRNA-degrading endonuclease YafQ of YafQ-DinJ toxin-antitoxin module
MRSNIIKTLKRDEIFDRHYAERIAVDLTLAELFDSQLAIFLTDRENPKINDHHLSWGMQGKRAFSITKDIRVVYVETDETFLFLDIGTHKQVYKQR